MLKMEELIGERVKKLIDYQGLTIHSFEKKIGSGNNVIGTNFKRGSNFSAGTLSKILNTFPDLNPEWLLTGRGEMLREALPVATPAPLGKGIPLIPLDAVAGKGMELLLSVREDEITERYIIPEFDRVKPDYLIRVKGSSMSPKYNSGDIIAIKRIPMDDFIQWNKPHVLDTETQGILVKRIRKSKKEGCWLLFSDNEKYDPFDIPLRKVRNISLVVGVIRLE